jgi:DNA-binding LytR/AlgR family response regulator
MMDQASDNPGAWAGQRPSGDEPRRRGTSGASAVTSGAWAIARAYAVIAAILALGAWVNVFTAIDDARRIGHPLAVAEFTVLEVTSAVGAIVAAAVVLVALRRARWQRGRIGSALMIHAAATVVFSVLHVGVMAALRWAIFAGAGHHYHMALSELPYEYRKDLITYLGLAGVFWLLARPAATSATPAPPALDPPGPAPTFDIRDGNAVLRVAVADIVCAQAAGNYVEFRLADGHRPLMRAPLSQVQAALAPHAFLRTHRSWLVNAARVRAIQPAGSGDFRLELDQGLCAPLSRRFPDALAQLRG